MQNSRLHATSFIITENMGLVPLKTDSKQKDVVGGSLSKLEAVLKAQEIDRRELFDAPGAPQKANAKQQHMKNLYVQEDTQLNAYKNSLGDYSNIASQMRTDNDNAVRSMNVSTMQSADEITKISNQNFIYNGLASELGLLHASERQYKKSKKVNRLSSQINYL